MDAESRAALLHATTEVFHLAAVYSLAMPRALGMQVNVLGTQHVLDFAQRLTNLRCGFQVLGLEYAERRAGRSRGCGRL